jgi:hypothetical protein
LEIFSNLETENEKIFGWTYENKYTALISKVEPQIKTKPFLENCRNLINLSHAYSVALHGTDMDSKLEYYWIYYFSQHTPLSDL